MKVGRSHNESENMFHTRFRLHRKSDTEFQWKRKGTGDGSHNLISDIQSKDYSTYIVVSIEVCNLLLISFPPSIMQ